MWRLRNKRVGSVRKLRTNGILFTRYSHYDEGTILSQSSLSCLFSAVQRLLNLLPLVSLVTSFEDVIFHKYARIPSTNCRAIRVKIERTRSNRRSFAKKWKEANPTVRSQTRQLATRKRQSRFSNQLSNDEIVFANSVTYAYRRNTCALDM